MDTKTTIHKLFYMAIVEIREEAYNIKNPKIFHLADLFHNVPLRLEHADEQEYTELLNRVKEDAKEKNCQQWLDNAMKSIEA